MINIKKLFITILLLAFAANLFFPQPALAEGEVQFECANLKAALADIIGHENITQEDMSKLSGKLDLSYNNITSVEGLQYAQNVDELILSFNNIEDISPITGLSNLDTLYLDYNWITSLPDAVTGLTSLEHLDISNNAIETIPAQFLQMPALRRLYMGDLELSAPPELSPLSATLNRLDLSGAKVGSFDFVSGLTNLELLIMNGCDMQALPDLSAMSKLEYLYFADNNIVTLPDYLGYLPLIRLDFSGNLISVMPQSFENLGRLEQILFTDNYFTSLPAAVTRMGSLEVLMCGQNLIADVPDNISDLKNVKRASFASNDLSTLAKFTQFEIPYSYQISFDLNYLDLADAVNAEVLQDYHNSGGTQRQARLAADVVSADTNALTVQCGIVESVLSRLGENTAYDSLKFFSMQNGALIPVGETDLSAEGAGLFVTYANPPEGAGDYLVCLVVKDSSWPEKYIKYSAVLQGVQVVPAPTAEPTDTPAPATAVPTAEPTPEQAPQKGIQAKYLLYILLLGVIIIISAIILNIVSKRRR